MCAPLAGSEGGGRVVVLDVGRVIHKITENKVWLLRWRRSFVSHGVALNQIQAALSEKSSSSLLHEVHIKGGL